tara:strand:- start:2888 stop:3148 length:261 start_codon:yes stop_codon:yes gene_type:complete
MEAIEGHLIDILMTVVSTALFGLIGFVWKISHKISNLEKTVDTLHKMQSRDVTDLRKDIDMICANMDKNREWTTNRMMSIAKEMPR